MTIKTDTRNMGYAVSKLFPNAFATYRDNIYKVELIVSDKNLILDWDVYEAMRQRLRLLEPESTWMLPVLKKPDDESEKARYYEEFINRINLHEISKIQCRLSEELKVFMCSNCGRLYIGTTNIAGQNKFTFYCSVCHNILNQAPILVRTKGDTERNRASLIRRISAKSGLCRNPDCSSYNTENWLGLKMQDPEQPMASLMWICTTCGESVALFESYKYGYKPQEPTENLTKGITVSVAKDYNPKKISNIPFLDTNMIKDISFSNNIKVWQVTWGYKLGQYENVQYKVFPNNNYYGRKINTQGLSITLNNDAFKIAKDYLKKCYADDPDYFKEFENDISSDSELQLKRWVLHSLEHAIIMFLPIISGLPHMEFAGSYDLAQNKVIIYDNEEGGIGGCKKLIDDEDNLINLFDHVSSRITGCDCINKCPKCLAALESCGEVSQALNRHLLTRLFIGGESFYV